ncbi:DUF3108 domain-containing protein [Alphaproteobacteria bacterium]|nr:DUF3108 domain-containing protein [Alphaproteobacteria bacterium]
MKLFFSLIILLLFTQKALGKDLESKYLVKTKGIVIGKLVWNLKITENLYKSSITLSDKGLLSAIYKFDGLYEVSGSIKNTMLIPNRYTQRWITKKKERFVEIFFKNRNISNLQIKPTETEIARINYQNLKDYSDPITSFINIFFNNIGSNTIDGRRIYYLLPTKEDGYTKVFVNNYTNIWADHKRNDLEYLEVFGIHNKGLPDRINIKFKGSVFSLIKN